MGAGILRTQGRWVLLFFIVMAFIWGGTRWLGNSGSQQQHGTAQEGVLTKDTLAEAIGSHSNTSDLPEQLKLEVEGKSEQVKVHYAFDAKLQAQMEEQFRHYKPDYGAFVALDASTGRVLSMVSYTKDGDLKGNLALRATFPSASIFKVVTAAAAIEEGKLTARTVVPFNGGAHTLYRRNVLQMKTSRWTRYMTLKEAFARSVNPVFARLGAFTVGAAELRDYAGRFGFNRKISADVPMQQGQAPITDDAWALAEAASGFTRHNTMSPMQGALIAAAIANDGVMMEPYVIDRVQAMDGAELYQAYPRVAQTSVDVGTAAEIRALMRETVTRGTSRGSFRKFFKGEFAMLDVGGKTGSLTGDDPQGRYDWFVGYAGHGPERIAFAALTVNKKYWTVKSAYLARLAIENRFKGRMRELHDTGQRQAARAHSLIPQAVAAE